MKRNVNQPKSHTPIYDAWSHAKQRCNNPKNKSYCNYGARGIKVCKRWSGSKGFTNFFKDMGPKPNPLFTLERIDNNGDYEPGNCKWATYRQQNLNKRLLPNNTSGHAGVSWHKVGRKWRAMLNTTYLGLFDNIEDAIAAYEKKKHEVTG